MSKIREGSPAAHGAIWDGKGTNFTLCSAHATKVEVCLFDRTGAKELERLALPASGDVFNHFGRRPWACVNFISAHDGFTLNDLVSYNEKHNEANGEENRDGSSATVGIAALRARRRTRQSMNCAIVRCGTFYWNSPCR
jgi:pullulanase/glycogen debranching enzyme